jgi:hypothetical protein
MTTTPQPAARRRFRFGLRTLLMVVTLAAVASWWYSFGLPWYVQSRFERTAMQFKSGVTLDYIRTSLTTAAHPATTQYYPMDSKKEQSVTAFMLTDAIYFVCLGYSMNRQADYLEEPSNRIEVFRSPRPANSTAPPFKDFFKYLHSARTNVTGFQCELIYSDPPAQEKSH